MIGDHKQGVLNQNVLVIYCTFDVFLLLVCPLIFRVINCD
jgi:hypothetical protein